MAYHGGGTECFQTFVNVPKVLQQRSLELIGEGHAYFDLKRFRSGIDRNYSGSNHHSSARKTVSGDSPNWIYKIPMTAIDDDVNFNLTEADNQ